MTVFDLAALLVIGFSATIGLWRGVIREVFALGAWLIALVYMVAFGGKMALTLNVAADTPWLYGLVGYLAAFVIAFVAVSVLGFVLSRAVASVGLGFLDRALGIIFGALRGGLIMTLLVLVLGTTPLPQSDGWKNSLSAKTFETFAAMLRGRMSDDVANKIQFK